MIGRYGWQKLVTSFFFHANDHHFVYGAAAAEVTLLVKQMPTGVVCLSPCSFPGCPPLAPCDNTMLFERVSTATICLSSESSSYSPSLMFGGNTVLFKETSTATMCLSLSLFPTALPLTSWNNTVLSNQISPATICLSPHHPYTNILQQQHTSKRTNSVQRLHFKQFCGF